MSNYFSRFWLGYRRTRGVQGELMAFLICLILGLVAVPCLIWIVGRLLLGPYSNGGLFSLWRDFLQGLGAGSLAFWVIALGPYCLLWLLRAGRWLFYGSRSRAST